MLPTVASLPAIWVFTGLWGSFFWYEINKDNPRNPEWVSWPVIAAPFLFLAVAGAAIYFARGARVFTALYVAVNLYFMLTMWLLATMAISGDWI